MLDYLRSEDEGVDVVTEEFSSSRGSSETQGPLGERGKCSMELPCSQPQCRAADKLDNIMKAGAHSIVLLRISLRLRHSRSEIHMTGVMTGGFCALLSSMERIPHSSLLQVLFF